MKKLFTLVLLTMSFTAWGAETVFTSGDLVFMVNAEPTSSDTYGEATCLMLSPAGQAKSSFTLQIPFIVSNSNKDYRVLTVEENAFQDKTNITGVRFAYGIKDIKAGSFKGCTKIGSVYLPSSISHLRSNAFAGCTALNRVYYAGNASSIVTYSSAFPNSTTCTLYVPYGTNDATIRSKAAFNMACFATIKHTNAAYDYYMIDGTKFVVTKPSTSTSTPHECTIIGFTNSESIGGRYNPNISTRPTGQDRPFKYTAISDSAFIDNTDLIELDLSRATGIEKIGKAALSGCSKLSKVNLGNVKTIDNYAFTGCTSLTSLNIPASTYSISTRTFVDNCTNLTKIVVDEGNTNYSSDNSSIYNKDKTILYRVPEAHPYSNKIFPTYLKIVDAYALFHVKNITQIEFNYGIEEIGPYTFQGCTKLKEVFIPGTIKTLEHNAFIQCSGLTDVYINAATPVTINRYSVFNSAANPNLHVPDGKIDAYKAAGWTDFLSYNKDYVVSRDYCDTDKIDYIITSTAPETINGKAYVGRAQVVRSGAYAQISGGKTIPEFIFVQNKKFAVTSIGRNAFATTSNFSITGCTLVDTVGTNAFKETPIQSIELPYVSVINNYAFDGCSQLTSVRWGNRLKYLDNHAFRNTGIVHDIIFPVGMRRIGTEAFLGSKVKRMHVPSTLISTVFASFNGMGSLTELICNFGSYFSSSYTIKLNDIPNTCKIVVPVGYKAIAQAHPSWSRFTNIEEGAYDFSYDGSLTTMYKMTVTSTFPVTKDGVTYDGTAKYVYNSALKSASNFLADSYEVDNMCGGERKYLMTAIGDSCFAYSNITQFDFSRIKYLKDICKKAFYGSKLEKVEIGNNVTFNTDAFTNATNLHEIYMTTDDFGWKDKFFGNNAADFCLYMPNHVLNNVLNSDLKEYSYNSTQKCADRVSSWIRPTSTTYNLGSLVSLDFTDCDYKIYSVNYPPNTNCILATEEYTGKVANAGRGYILTDLVPNQVYKIKRKPYAILSTPAHAMVAKTTTDLFNIANTYYWDLDGKKFVRVTGSYTLDSGRSYLVMSSGAPELYLDIFAPTGTPGDVNGDGTIDISDVNVTINIMLGKVGAASYPAADVNHDGTVDIADVNMILNTMLGK